MNPRLRLGLIFLGMAIIIGSVIAQFIVGVFLPYRTYVRERHEDFERFQPIELGVGETRAGVEQSLPGWRHRDRDVWDRAACEAVYHGQPRAAPCQNGTRVVEYWYREPDPRSPALVPLHVLVFYAPDGRVVGALTRDEASKTR